MTEPDVYVVRQDEPNEVTFYEMAGEMLWMLLKATRELSKIENADFAVYEQIRRNVETLCSSVNRL